MMVNQASFFPQAIYGTTTLDPAGVPRVLISPHRYIQGQGTLDHLGKYMSIIDSERPAVLFSIGGEKRFGEQIGHSLKSVGIRYTMEIFEGECSENEVERLVSLLKNKTSDIDAVIAVGGGKCMDVGKAVAFRLGLPIVTCPTIASTDAPCSAVSVMYSDEGVQLGPEFFPNSPALVVVDTRVIIKAPIRQLVAGMGDALATYYEARTCFQNLRARSVIGARPTITALAISELCAKTILENGTNAVDAMLRQEPDEAFEQIVEANTLLSGIGFESGGLAAAHAVAAGLTEIPVLHRDFFHGELVGIGILSHLLLESKVDEAEEVAEFMAGVGLPIHAGQLSLDMEEDAPSIKKAMEGAVSSHLTDAEPFEVSPEKLFAAFVEANLLGVKITQALGDAAYGRLHP
jgi:glycerol dehydrogenase